VRDLAGDRKARRIFAERAQVGLQEWQLAAARIQPQRAKPIDRTQPCSSAAWKPQKPARIPR
jgi:hypothetical protein